MFYLNMNYNNGTNYFQERCEYATSEKTSIIKIGKSNGVVLLKAWVDYYGIESRTWCCWVDLPPKNGNTLTCKQGIKQNLPVTN